MLKLLQIEFYIKRLFINFFFIFNKQKRKAKRNKLYMNYMKNAISYKYKDYWIFIPRWSYGDIFICAALMEKFKEKFGGKILFIVSKKSIIPLLSKFTSIDKIICDPFANAMQGEIQHEPKNKGELCCLFAPYKHAKKCETLIDNYLNLLNLQDKRPQFSEICISETDIDRVKRKCRELGFDINKTVLFIPESVTFKYKQLSENFWIDLARYYENLGYNVVFNTQDKKYKKFNTIFFDLLDTVIFAKSCDKVIAFRSGLTDILAGANVKNLCVIYPHNGKTNFWSEADFVKNLQKDHVWNNELSISQNILNIYSLNKMFNRNDIDEVIYNGNEAELKNRILGNHVEPGKEEHLVSVFIPYYNDEDYISESIESVINQSYQNWELILLNHACTDNSRNIAHSYKDERIKHIDMKYNLGAGSGVLISKFLEIAQGKYIKTFCADDKMLPNCLSDLVNYMEENKDIDFAFGNLKFFDNNVEEFPKDNWFDMLYKRNKIKRNFDKIEPNLAKIYKDYFDGITDFPLPYPANIIKRDALADFRFNKTFIMMFDMSLWLNLLLNNKKIGFCNKFIAKYRFSPQQMSSLLYYEKNMRLLKFEKLSFFKYALKIKDIKLLKEIYTSDALIQSLSESESEFIPFVIAHHYSTSQNTSLRIGALETLFEILNGDLTDIIKERFNYGIKEFREEYTKNEIYLSEKKDSNIFSINLYISDKGLNLKIGKRIKMRLINKNLIWIDKKALTILNKYKIKLDLQNSLLARNKIGGGGANYALNYFFCNLLRALGGLQYA